jgi:DNA gyrase subunit A
LQEPDVLPSRIPNLLINGSSGIAVGMSTNIPPHNLKEVMNALIYLIDHPQCDILDLLNFISGPDFPTAGAIIGREGIREAYLTGKGILQLRAKAEIEDFKDRQRIVVTQIPYQVNKSTLVEKIAELVNEKVLVGIGDIRDESNRLGIRIAIDLKRGENASVILNRLYKHTQMQISFGIIFLAISKGRPVVLNLKELLQAFIDHRKEVIVRRTLFDLKKAQAREHILEGLKIAVSNIDPMIELIKNSLDPATAKDSLMKKYALSEIQAQSILDMRLQRITGLERQKILKELEELKGEIVHLNNILQDSGLVDKIMKDEFLDTIAQYQDERRTEIIAANDDLDIEDLIKDEEVIVTLTHRGYLKRMQIDTYRTQKRGGVGVKGADTNKDDDFFVNIFTARTHSSILFFTNKGTVFSKKVYNIPEGTRISKGRNIANLINIPPGEIIREIMPIPKEIDFSDKYLIFATKQGLIKKSEISEYKNIHQGGIRAIKVQDGDDIVSVRITDGSKDVLICASSGKIIRFPESDCRPMGRISQGVRGIMLEDAERVIGMEIIDDGMEILSVTEDGFGKRTSAREYRKQSRGGRGIIAMRLTDKTGNIVQIKPVKDEDDLMIITDKGQVIRTRMAGISLLGRATQGVRIIRVKEGEKVVAVERVMEGDDPASDSM